MNKVMLPKHAVLSFISQECSDYHEILSRRVNLICCGKTYREACESRIEALLALNKIMECVKKYEQFDNITTNVIEVSLPIGGEGSE